MWPSEKGHIQTSVHAGGIASALIRFRTSFSVSFEPSAAVKIHRIIAATDPGHAVNPAQIERQIAGSFVSGLSAVFYQGCTVTDGRIEC
jgi:CO/xanthine dehydrogenase Mo-binding subunit